MEEVHAFVLTIDSTPPGATVTENGKALGVTPITITVDRKSVASAPRAFVLQRDGYIPSTIEQGDAESAVRRSAVLAAGSRSNLTPWRAAAQPRPGIQASSALPPPVEVPSARRNEGGPRLDIRLRR
jgi:serine/threonine-protein kinase